jgi:hypothetical protein
MTNKFNGMVNKERKDLSKAKKEFAESQLHRVPNELRSQLYGINHRVSNGYTYHSDTDYSLKIKD